MSAMLLFVAAGMIVLVALFHSVAGQKKLIGPLLQGHTEILSNPTWRALIVFGWHSTTALILLIALYLALVAGGYTAGNDLQLTATAVTFIVLGIANAILAKFKHPGWIMLSSVGIIILTALYI
ncbi:MAG: hypothetical protein ABJO01_16330 [Parasphingorhabdus sp.]|uniref:hypothetical protein n=1 Tax=Parasphingorhabdus sp. TaxID=2709688 RepID=UPI00329A7A5A